MKKIFSWVFILTTIFSIRAANAINFFDTLTDGQKISEFEVQSVYENNRGIAMGARFVSSEYSFILDVLHMQSVPQGFFWVKTPPKWDKGEPHTCEHLLLGKGNRGRYVATLENMSLGKSTAYTAQTLTAYHFNTIAGTETFYSIFEAKLRALLHPDFTDEEIRREVAHVGVSIDQSDSSLKLEEKGTVYTEMVSGYEKPWSYLWGAMNDILYGENHLLSNISGGEPSAIRTMIPEDLWEFHRDFHHLSNMGAIVAVPASEDVELLLLKMDNILKDNQDYRDSTDQLGIGAYDFPSPIAEPERGKIQINDYPSENRQDMGQILMSWSAHLHLNLGELLLLELFMQAFSTGTSSNLYKLLINSETKAIDFPIGYVSGSVSRDLGNPVSIHMGGLDKSKINDHDIKNLRNLILDEIKSVAILEDGSENLTKFNQAVLNRLTHTRKRYAQFLDSPPMFGFRRGPAGAWIDQLKLLERKGGFRKSLVLKEELGRIEDLLKSDENIWRKQFERWQLLSVAPYAVGIKPSTEMAAKAIADKRRRLDGYAEDYKQRYDTDSAQEAIAKYKQEFDRNTAELEKIAGQQIMPGFIENPPLSLDENLDYEVIELVGGVTLTATTFENMTSSSVGIAFDLRSLPDSMYIYTPILPDILTSIGVIRNDSTISHDQMSEMLRREILSLDSYFSFGMEAGRVELVLKGAAAENSEIKDVFKWMGDALHHPYLSQENNPRLLDVINQRLISLRNRMKGSEESWVDGVSLAYQHQDDPLYLSTACFLTQIHHLHRLKWLLTDSVEDAVFGEVKAEVSKLIQFVDHNNREEIDRLLNNLAYDHLSSGAIEIVINIVDDLKVTITSIPDENLVEDWKYLCNQIVSDLSEDPIITIGNMIVALETIRLRENARLFMVSNSVDREFALDLFNPSFLMSSGDKPLSSRPNFSPSSKIIFENMSSRFGDGKEPTYVGLINDNTRNGVLMFRAILGKPYDMSEDAVRNSLAGKLFGGGGGHGFFMRTWSAGLAYSNGIRTNNRRGDVRYYAERCPDVAQTMRFVVNVLDEAEENPQLAKYVIALSFGASRAPAKYVFRGEEMAADLADGFTPAMIGKYREKVLEVGISQGLYADLTARMKKVYGSVLVGYGENLSKVDNGSFFLIGPEEQFELMEAYIAEVEKPVKIARLYPRDFWVK